MRWEKQTLGQCARFINGRAYSQEELLDQGTPVIRIQNLNGGDRWYYSNLQLPDDKYCVAGDLLFAWSASFGPYLWYGDRAIFRYHIWRILPSPGVDKAFLYRLLEWITARVKGASRGVAMLHMTKAGIEAWEVSIPPLPEQRRIAAILDQADALRAKRREALAQLDSLTHSIFTEMFGDYRTERLPWPTRTLEDVAAEMTIGLVRSAAEFGPDFETPYVRMNAIGQRGEFLPSLVMRTAVSADEFERYALKPGDLLFNTRNSRELVGKTALFRETGPYVFNNNLMRIRVKSAMHPEYVAAAFQTPFIQQELEIRKAGTTSVFAIYARELKTVPIPVPPLALQQTFATRIQAVESLKATHRAALAESDALFAALQHRAFAGGL